MHRYEYLKDTRNNFHNPYDRGIVKNWMEFFNMIPPLKLGIDESQDSQLFPV